MLGQFFVHFDQQPNGTTNVRTGVVKHKLGAEHWQLEFDGANYKFANVFSAQQLQHFAFFESIAARAAFIEELRAPQQPQLPETPLEQTTVTQ